MKWLNVLGRIAVSNIAWPFGFEQEMLQILHCFDLKNLEIAPTKIFGAPVPSDISVAYEARQRYERQGFSIVSAQSLLFGRPELQLFSSSELRRETLKYVKHVVSFCLALGAAKIVFGSPKNRIRGSLVASEALHLAQEFFHEIAAFAYDRGGAIALEANSTAYGCDFLTTTDQAADFVRIVNHRGLVLHIDTGNMLLENENIQDVLLRHGPEAGHCQISSPYLRPLSELGTSLNLTEPISSVLARGGYCGYVALEMLLNQENSAVAAAELHASIDWLLAHY